MNQRSVILVSLTISTLCMAGLLCLFLDCSLVDDLFSNQFSAWVILVSALSVGLAVFIVRLENKVTPSFVLYLFFAGYCALGPVGARLYEGLHGLYHGKYALISDFPSFVWMVGTTALLFGILASHLLLSKIRIPRSVVWEHRRITFGIYFMIGIALLSTAFVLYKVGFIPVLSGNMDPRLISYDEIAGEYPLKFSRLWLVVVCVASMLIFVGKNRVLYTIVTVVSLVALLIYGQRNYFFVALSSLGLVVNKFRHLTLSHIMFGLAIVVSLILFAEVRTGRGLERLDIAETLVLNATREWREYTIVVNHVSVTSQFYGQDIFLGALVPILPKEVWAVFGVDKEYVTRKYGANYVFGDQFGDAIGIRIGTIGEAYAGYGMIYGVCVQLFAFGFLFGALECFYLVLDKSDARLVLVSFGMGLLLWLPIATLYVTIAYGVFFGFFLVVLYLIGSQRTGIISDEELDT